jgi:hypothetical protein
MLMTACGRDPSPEPAEQRSASPEERSASEHGPQELAAIARANDAADRLGRELRGRLLAAMENGPPSAVEVCSSEAPAIASAIVESTGARVGRSSLRLRNSANAAPPWVATWLTETGERPASEVQGFTRVESGVARVLRPIAVEGPCLHCHGETIAPEVAEKLRDRYPDDRATGYRLGDLRGALWAEAPL